MSNEVWVRWKISTTGEWIFDTVGNLKNDARIKDLRNAFVAQRRGAFWDAVDPAIVEVRETEHGEKLKASTKLTNYFEPPSNVAAARGPGKVEDSALYVTFPALSQHNDSPEDTAVHKLLPLIEVLPDLLREVNLTRKIRLNPWERESARTTESKRSDIFRKKVMSYYRRISQSKKNVKCQVLDMFTPIDEAQDKIIAAHIWKASTRGKGLLEFGLEENDVNSPRNGLFLTKGIEDAFDKQQICFLYNILESKLVLWIADSNIMTETIEGSTWKFSDVHQRPLICPANCLPYRRLLSWHARLTLERRKESIQVENFTSEYDNSSGRKTSKDDPIAYAINSMVEPGDDASVGNDEP